MSLITSVWLDMDNTLMDFNKGNLDRALESMVCPVYYKSVVPFDSALDAVGRLSDTCSVNIVSGIPDPIRHKKYLGNLSCEEYMSYYEDVKQAKLEVLYNYFGKGFFDIIEFTKASESKASIIKNRFYNNDTKEFSHTALIDDLAPYVISWRKAGGHGFVCSPSKPLSLIVNDIIEVKY